MNKEKYTKIVVPTEVADKINIMLEDSKFNSLSIYVTHILTKIVKENISKDTDEEKLERRLKSLGYLD